MSKFKVNDVVRIKATNELGTIKAREEIVTDEATKHISIQYVVKTGEGFDKWKAFSKKEIEKLPKKPIDPYAGYIKKTYDLPNGYVLTLVAFVDTINEYTINEYTEELVTTKAKICNIGHSIYNPIDKYNELTGFKIAKSRLTTRPFAHLYSEFTGEFGYDTVVAIMDAKAKYIYNNYKKFITK